MHREYLELQFVEKYRCITASQAAHMFYRGLKSGRRQAMGRLNMLVEIGKLKKYQNGIHGEVQYYTGKRQKRHQVKLLDMYTAMVALGYQNVKLLPEVTVTTKPLGTNKTKIYRVDAILEYINDGVQYRDFVEIDDTHNSDQDDRHKNIAYQRYYEWYCRCRDGELHDGYKERLVVVKNYLLYAHAKCGWFEKPDTEKPLAHPLTFVPYQFNIYFLPWNLNSYFFSEEAEMIKAAADKKQKDQVARKIRVKNEKKLNPYEQFYQDMFADDGKEKAIKILKKEIKELPNIIYIK